MKLVVVLRARDVTATRAFYESMGLRFVEEQHGTGPRHAAADCGEWVLEIYPATANAPTATTELIFEGAAGGVDPDGRRVLRDR